MNQFLTLLLLFCTINCFSQNKVTHTIGDLSILLPENFEVDERKGHEIITAKIENGLILIAKSPSSQTMPLEYFKDKNELILYYDGFQEGALSKLKGELLKEEVFELDNLFGKRYVARVNFEEEIQIRESNLFIIKSNLYLIQLWQLESKLEELKNERDDLFLSIKLKQGLSLKDQLGNRKITLHQNNLVDQEMMERSHKQNELAFRAGQYVGMIFILSIVGLFIHFLVKLVKKIFKKNEY